MQNAIISDSSCLILLQKIDHLFLLEKLFGQVIITPEVLMEYGQQLPQWIIVKKPSNQKYQLIINSALDSGEASAIALAVELENPLLILDDLKARNFAKSLNLQYTGTLGIILNAKKNNIIDNVKDVLTLIEETDFWLSKELKMTLLRLAKEK